MIEMINKLVQIVVMSAYVIMVLIKKLSYIHYMGGGGAKTFQRGLFTPSGKDTNSKRSYLLERHAASFHPADSAL